MTIKKIQEIIEKYKDYLKKNDLKGFYEELRININEDSDVGEITQYFYEMGADPLEYTDEIPYGFLAGTDIESFTIPNHIKKIGDSAFSVCDNLKSIVIPENVTIIDTWAFFHCISLKSIKLPDTVEKIESWAFSDCHNLTDINVPKNLKRVSSLAFDECPQETYRKFEEFM